MVMTNQACSGRRRVDVWESTRDHLPARQLVQLTIGSAVCRRAREDNSRSASEQPKMCNTS